MIAQIHLDRLSDELVRSAFVSAVDRAQNEREPTQILRDGEIVAVVMSNTVHCEGQITLPMIGGGSGN